jgi:glycosyltransferase involved in cell wall biosynthesis
LKVAHLTTVDLSLRFLVFSQLRSVVSLGGEAVGISAPGRWVEDLQRSGIRHLPLNSSTRGVAPLADFRSAWQLWRILRRERFDVLHTHNPKPGLYGRILGRLAGVPIVVNTVHGLYATEDDAVAKRAVVYLLEALASRFSDAELVQSREDLRLIHRLHLAPPGRALWLGNGIDLARFGPHTSAGPDRADVRRSLGLHEDEIVVGMVGRLVREKGYPEFFEAVSQLGDGYVAVVVGPIDPDKADSLDPTLIESARSNGTRFLGMRPDIHHLYRAMDIFVLPSHREGFPRAAMEAAATGLPIVATDIRGCREVVDDGVNGLLVPVRKPAELAAAIRRLGEDRSLREVMGRAGRHKALLDFDERRVVDTVVDTYRAVAVAKGMSDLATELGPRSEPKVRPAGVEDAAALARLHISAIQTGFLPRLGHRFMTVLYRALVGWEAAVVLVADPGGGPIGFVAGGTDTARFYRYFFRRYLLPAVWTALPALLRPRNLRRAVETARYGGVSATGAELLAMAVDEGWRGAGIGLRLGHDFLDAMTRLGHDPVRVVVGDDNEVAKSAYRRMGFVATDNVELHPGEPSQVLMWSS